MGADTMSNLQAINLPEVGQIFYSLDTKKHYVIMKEGGLLKLFFVYDKTQDYICSYEPKCMTIDGILSTAFRSPNKLTVDGKPVFDIKIYNGQIYQHCDNHYILIRDCSLKYHVLSLSSMIGQAGLSNLTEEEMVQKIKDYGFVLTDKKISY